MTLRISLLPFLFKCCFVFLIKILFSPLCTVCVMTILAFSTKLFIFHSLNWPGLRTIRQQVAQHTPGIFHGISPIKTSIGPIEHINYTIFETLDCRLGNLITITVLLKNLFIIHDIPYRVHSKSS